MRAFRLNERTLIVEFGTEISEELSREVLSAHQKLRDNAPPEVEDIWPTYGSLAVQCNSSAFEPEELIALLTSLTGKEANPKPYVPKEVIIPTRYDGETSEDMRALSDSLQLTPTEIIQLHSESTYTVAMIGFLPGFPYLIGLPEKLHHPRKSKPSLHIPGGSVAIGGAQTGIYPNAGPGGWYVIGHTGTPLFTAPDRFLLSPGDQVQFQPT